MKTKYHITKNGKTVDQYGREFKISNEDNSHKRKRNRNGIRSNYKSDAIRTLKLK